MTRAEHVEWACVGALLTEALGWTLREVTAMLSAELGQRDPVAAALAHGALSPLVAKGDRDAVRLFVQRLLIGARWAREHDDVRR